MVQLSFRPRASAVAVAFLAAFPALSQTSGQESGSWFTNLLRYGGLTAPPAAPSPSDDAYCPAVGIIEGGSAMQAFSGGRTGDANALRHQISIAQVARECTAQENGAILVKVGIEGRALVGPAGSAGRFDSPVTFVIKRGDRVVAAKTQRVAVAIPPGETQASFIAVENGLVVPPGTGEYEIEVGLVHGAGTGAPAERRSKKGRRG